jgi:hypothetical protein
MLTKVCTNQNCPAYAHFVFTLGMRWRAISFASIFLLVGQSSGQSPSSENHPALNAPTAGRFVDVTEKLGIHFKHTASPTSKKYLLETMGSGVALFDYDNDGRLDLFFANGARIDDPTPKGTIPQKDGPKYWNRLYHQKSDGNFEDVTEKAGVAGSGYSTGVAVGDYDNDGFDDLFVAGYGHSALYHNSEFINELAKAIWLASNFALRSN